MKKVYPNTNETSASEIGALRLAVGIYTSFAPQKTAMSAMSLPMSAEVTQDNKTTYNDSADIVFSFPIKVKEERVKSDITNTLIGKFPDFHSNVGNVGKSRPPLRFIRKSNDTGLRCGKNAYVPTDHYATALKAAIVCVTGLEVSGKHGCEHWIIRRVFIDHLIMAGYSSGDIRKNTDRRMNPEFHAATHSRRRIAYDGYRALVDNLNTQIGRCLAGRRYQRVDMLAEIAKAKDADGRVWR